MSVTDANERLKALAAAGEPRAQRLLARVTGDLAGRDHWVNRPGKGLR